MSQLESQAQSVLRAYPSTSHLDNLKPLGATMKILIVFFLWVALGNAASATCNSFWGGGPISSTLGVRPPSDPLPLPEYEFCAKTGGPAYWRRFVAPSRYEPLVAEAGGGDAFMIMRPHPATNVKSLYLITTCTTAGMGQHTTSPENGIWNCPNTNYAPDSQYIKRFKLRVGGLSRDWYSVRYRCWSADYGYPEVKPEPHGWKSEGSWCGSTGSDRWITKLEIEFSRKRTRRR